MKRVGPILLLFALVLSGGAGLPPEPAEELTGPGERPNVLIVTTDDLNEEVYRESGRLRGLLEPEGTVFENAFVTDPLCCPSRATMLRGQYPHNTGVLSNAYPSGGNRRFEELRRDEATVATRMRRGGYETAFFGKYLNGKGGAYSPPGWDRYHQAGWHGTYADLGRTFDYPDGAWRDDVTGAKAARWLRQRGSGPFFSWVSFQSPHSELGEAAGTTRGDGYAPADRHLHTRDGARLAPKPSRPEEDLSDKPRWVRENAAWAGENPPTTEEDYRRQLEMVEGVADNLARILRALRDTGELGNTYVLFTSDNGYMLSEHSVRPSKLAPYEESIGVPLVVRGPGIAAGARRGELALNNDLSPTVLDWAGVRPHGFADGRSLAPLARGEDTPWRTGFLIYNREPQNSQFGNPVPPTYRGVRTEDWKYVRYSTGEEELYDLEADPHETENLSGRPEYAGKEAELGARVDALRACAAEACRAAEGP